jgi:hypothetical protein
MDWTRHDRLLSWGIDPQSLRPQRLRPKSVVAEVHTTEHPETPKGERDVDRFPGHLRCGEPRAAGRVLGARLNYELEKPPSGFTSWEEFAEKIGLPRERWDSMAAVVDPEKSGPRLLFQRVPEGKTAENRMHLDVNATKPHGHIDQG